MRKFKINVNGTSYDVEVEEIGGGAVSAPAPMTAPTPMAAAAAAPAAAPAVASAGSVPDGTKIEAPMPGNILDVKVAVGDSVNEGDILMILEAMKMENEILAPVSGKVVGVQTSAGSAVNSGDVLIVIA